MAQQVFLSTIYPVAYSACSVVGLVFILYSLRKRYINVSYVRV